MSSKMANAPLVRLSRLRLAVDSARLATRDSASTNRTTMGGKRVAYLCVISPSKFAPGSWSSRMYRSRHVINHSHRATDIRPREIYQSVFEMSIWVSLLVLIVSCVSRKMRNRMNIINIYVHTSDKSESAKWSKCHHENSPVNDKKKMYVLKIHDFCDDAREYNADQSESRSYREMIGPIGLGIGCKSTAALLSTYEIQRVK